MSAHYATSYAADNLDKIWMDYRCFDFTRPDIARIRRQAPLEGARVLDVGCGTGVFLHALQRAGANRLVGIEPGMEKSRLAGERVRGATILATSYEEVELPAASFDVVTALDLLEHVYNPGEFLHFAARLLKPDGVLFLKTPNWNATRRYGAGWQGLQQDYEHVHYFSRVSLTNFLQRAGLVVEAIDYEPLTAGLTGKPAEPPVPTGVNPSRRLQGVLSSGVRTALRSIPGVNRATYRLLYLLRRSMNREEIASESAIELVAVARKRQG